MTSRRFAGCTSWSAVALMTILLLAVGAWGCGSRHGVQRSASSGSAISSSGLRPLSDEDRDGSGRAGYFDGDDGEVRYFGSVAGTGDTRAITVLVGRYYADAAAGDGKRACSLLYGLLAESLPEDYARPPGPLYLKGADSCPPLLSRVFKHFHSRLLAAPDVVAVRVSGDHADALLGWHTLPAGYIEARREGGVWKVDRPLAAPLP